MRFQHCAIVVGLITGAALAGSGCNDTVLPNALYDNRVDTLTLTAVDGTPVAKASALDIATPPAPRPMRTDLSTAWDFVFNIDTLGRALLIPSNALHLSNSSGLQLITNTSFSELRVAPGSGYNSDSATVVVPGYVVAIRSRLVNCELGTLFYYGKLRVLTVDLTARELTFEVLGDLNCGYRSLEPGHPTQ